MEEENILKTQSTEVQIKPTKRWLKIILTSLLALLLAGGLVFTGYKVGQRQVGLGIIQRPTPTPFVIPSPSSMPEEKAPVIPPATPTSKEKASFTKDKIFFVEEKNIFMIDKLGADKTQITNFPSTDFGYPQHLQVIDDEYLGFYKCDTKTGDFNCGIYRVSIVIKQPERIVREDADKLILQLAWYDRNTFAYTVSGKPAENWWIYLFKGGEKKTIEEIRGEPYGRGGYIEDSDKLAFSPDGTKIIHIATSSPRNGQDFNVYVFDLHGNSLARIENATQPAWLDNKMVIFRRKGEGLFGFDIFSKREKKFEGTSNNAYNPRVLRGLSKVVYWVNEGNGQVWFLDALTGKNEMLLNNASDPLWISKEEILVSENRKCLEDDPCMWRDFVSTAISVFNISSKSKTKLFESEDGIGGGNILYDVTYYNSHWTD